MKLSSVKPKGKDTEDGMGARSGPTIHLTHEHLKAMGQDTPLSHGTEVHFEGHGHVSDVSSHEDADGNAHHHMTITLEKAGMDHNEAEEPSGGLRDQLSKAVADRGKVKMAANRGDDAVTSRTEKKVTNRADMSKSSGAAKTEASKAEPKVKG